MDLKYTPEEEAFRARVALWIHENAPPKGLGGDLEALRAWQRKLWEAGFLGAGWPPEYGGTQLSPMEEAIFNEELARSDAPGPINAMAIWWVGPAILRYGTPAQKERFLRRILSAEELWATGYSEPGAGSDMASVRTRAVRESEWYVVNGQKVWTTIAHIADWYFLLVRTSTDGPKWAGLSVLLVDVKSPGIEVRPIRQITGDCEFNEVFLRDVRVPAENLLGNEGQGWEIVTTALVNERTGIAGSLRAEQNLARLVRLAERRGLMRDRLWRQRLAALAIEARVAKAFGLRALTDQLRGRLDPHMSAARKLFTTELAQHFSEVGVEMLGPYGGLWQDGPHTPDRGAWAYQYLYDRSATIAGGTSEVQRNIVARRVLGLPRSW